MCNISSILPRVRGSTCGFRRVLERSLQGGVCPIDALYWGKQRNATMFPLSSCSTIAREASIILAAMSSRVRCWVGYCKWRTSCWWVCLQLVPLLLLVAATPARRSNDESGRVLVIALLLPGSESGAVGRAIVFLLESGAEYMDCLAASRKIGRIYARRKRYE